MMYKIVRHFKEDDRRETIAEDLTLEEAKAHCNDPETSSNTATGEKERRMTEEFGAWFDSWVEE